MSATVGVDRQIYCKSCHSTSFQQTGYLTTDVTAVKGGPGELNSCVKVNNNFRREPGELNSCVKVNNNYRREPGELTALER